MTAAAVPTGDPGVARLDLAELLARSAAGDLAAFMQFYDASCDTAYRLARCSLVDEATAEQAVIQLYVAAWTRAGEHRDSGLSPLAWLLALPSGRDLASG